MSRKVKQNLVKMELYYFSIPGEEFIGKLAGPYVIDEIMKTISGFNYYLENRTFLTVPFKYEGKVYEDELVIFFDSDTVLFDKIKNPIKVTDIPEIQELLEKNAQIYGINRGDKLPSYIKLLPSSNEVFFRPNDIHTKFCFPILSVHLNKINPQWNEWVHLVIPSSYWSIDLSNEYDEIVAKRFEGWDSHYDFICLLDENCKYIIEQGNEYLIRDEADTDLEFLKQDYEYFRQSNPSLTLRIGAQYDDWYRKQHDTTYFSKNDSKIVHIVSVDIFGANIHLFYQPEYRRIIQFAQYT
jgi:hypothetical protein